MIEVLEIWWKEPDGIYTCTLGNRQIELSAPKKNPFWHGEYPFTVCTTRPDLFSIPGRSQVERIAHLQEAHWDLENQTRDNVRLINNAIFIIGDEVTDVDALEFEPGARWAVEGNPNEMVMPWQPNAISADSRSPPRPARAEDAEPRRRPPVHLDLGGAHRRRGHRDRSGAVDEHRRACDRPPEGALAYAYERIGQQRTELNQQFLRTSIMVEKIGLDNESEFVEVAPYLLQGAYKFDIAPMVESLMRSERRAEANAMFQTFLQAAGLYMALANAGAATAAERGRVRAAVARDVRGRRRRPVLLREAAARAAAGGARRSPGSPTGRCRPGRRDRAAVDRPGHLALGAGSPCPPRRQCSASARPVEVFPIPEYPQLQDFAFWTDDRRAIAVRAYTEEDAWQRLTEEEQKLVLRVEIVGKPVSPTTSGSSSRSSPSTRRGGSSAASQGADGRALPHARDRVRAAESASPTTTGCSGCAASSPG
jgi:hypothetical protein